MFCYTVKPLITPHRLCQLKKLSGTLVKTLSDYSVKLSMKENDVARLDKAAWNKYDKLEGHVQNMIKTVDDTVQKHVSLSYPRAFLTCCLWNEVSTTLTNRCNA